MSAGEERLQLALEAGELGTWDWDLRAGHIQWDARTASIFGLSLEDFDGSYEAFSAVIHPDDAAGLAAAIEQAIASCGQFARDYRIVHQGTGETRWVAVRGRVLCDQHGEPEAMLGVAQDRTEAFSQGERLSRTLEAIDEAFVSLDEDWRFTYLNSRAEQLLGRTREELLGGDVWELFPEAIGTEFETRYRCVAETREPTTFEASYGPLGWFEVRAYPDTSGIAVYFRNITERRDEERRASRAHEAAARLLERAPTFGDHRDPAVLAATVCRVGRDVFDASRASLWRLDGDVATVVAQDGGTALPAGWQVAVDDIAGLRQALTTQQPLFLQDVQQAASPAHRDLARRKGVHSVALAPVGLGARTEVVLVSIGWDHVVEPLDATMLDLLQRFAQQAALAIEQVLRLEAEEQAASLNAQLQSSLLPAPFLERGDLEVASLYRTGERRLMLGGDFFDCMQLADGKVTMVIGDVTGHGPQAAAIGATLRAAWRAMALQGAAPGEKISALDAVLRLERATDEQMVSVCCVVVQPDLRSAVVVSAGHPPPLLLEGDQAVLLELPTGLLLGAPVDLGEPDEVRVALPERWGLLLYTDGLPEARCGDGTEDRLGLDAFGRMVAQADLLGSSAPDAALHHLHDRVRDCASTPIEDDVALLLLRCAEPARAAVAADHPAR